MSKDFDLDVFTSLGAVDDEISEELVHLVVLNDWQLQKIVCANDYMEVIEDLSLFIIRLICRVF